MTRRHARPIAGRYDAVHGIPRHPRTVTLREAAERLAVTPDNLRGAIARGTLAAVKHGRDWWVTEAALKTYQDEHLGQPGRKPGAKKKRTRP